MNYQDPLVHKGYIPVFLLVCCFTLLGAFCLSILFSYSSPFLSPFLFSSLQRESPTCLHQSTWWCDYKADSVHDSDQGSWQWKYKLKVKTQNTSIIAPEILSAAAMSESDGATTCKRNACPAQKKCPIGPAFQTEPCVVTTVIALPNLRSLADTRPQPTQSTTGAMMHMQTLLFPSH